MKQEKVFIVVTTISLKRKQILAAFFIDKIEKVCSHCINEFHTRHTMHIFTNNGSLRSDAHVEWRPFYFDMMKLKTEKAKYSLFLWWIQHSLRIIRWIVVVIVAICGHQTFQLACLQISMENFFATWIIRMIETNDSQVGNVYFVPTANTSRSRRLPFKNMRMKRELESYFML